MKRVNMIRFLLYFLSATVLLPTLLFSEFSLPFQTIEKAKKAYLKGEYQKSIVLLNALKQDDPTIYYNRANAEYKLGEYDKALLSYAKAKGVDEAMRLYNIGNIYFKRKNWNMAIESYEASLRLHEDIDSRFNLALSKKRKQAQKEDKKEDKKKSEKERKKEKEEKKKRDEERRKKREAQEKKKGQEKEKDNQKKEDDSNRKEKANQMMKKEKLTKKELKRLMKKLSNKRMPTMMYQTPLINRGDRDDKKPW